MNKATPHYDPQDERYEEEAAYVSQVARRQAAEGIASFDKSHLEAALRKGRRSRESVMPASNHNY